MSFIGLTITSSVSPMHSERRFNGTIKVGELKDKCELITGTPPAFMKLELRSRDNIKIRDLSDDLEELLSAGVQEGLILHVIDTSGGSANPAIINADGHSGGSGDDGIRFEISEDAYNARTDSVRAWKQRMGLGRFAENGASNTVARDSKAAKSQDLMAQGVQLAESMKVGNRCEVKVTEQPSRRGTIRYIGETSFKPGPWIGIQYDEPMGKNDGSVDGRAYFSCPANYGGFVRPQDLTVGDYPELGLEELDEI